MFVSVCLVVLAIRLWWHYKPSDNGTKPDYDNTSLRSDDTDYTCDSESLLSQESSRTFDKSVQEEVSSSSVGLLSLSSSLVETHASSEDVEIDMLILTVSNDKSTTSDKTQPEAAKVDHSSRPTARIDVLKITDKTQTPISELIEHASSIAGSDSYRDKKPTPMPAITDKKPTQISELNEHASSTKSTAGCCNKKPTPVHTTSENTPSPTSEDMKDPPSLVVKARVPGKKPRQMSDISDEHKMAILPEKKPSRLPEKTDKTEKTILRHKNPTSNSKILDSIEKAVFREKTQPPLLEQIYKKDVPNLPDKKPQAIPEETDIIEKTVLLEKKPTETPEVTVKSQTLITEHSNQIRSSAKIASLKKLPPPIPKTLDKNEKAIIPDKNLLDLSKPDQIGTAILLDKKNLSQMPEQLDSIQKAIFLDESTSLNSEKHDNYKIPILLCKKASTISERTDKSAKAFSTYKEPPSIPMKPQKNRQVIHMDKSFTPIPEHLDQISSPARNVSHNDKKIPQVTEKTNMNEIPVVFSPEKKVPPIPEKPDKNRIAIISGKTSESPIPTITDKTPTPPIIEHMAPASFSVRNAGPLDKKLESLNPKTKVKKSLSIIEKLDMTEPTIFGKRYRNEVAIPNKKPTPVVPISDMNGIQILPHKIPAPSIAYKPDKNKIDLFLEKKPPPTAEMFVKTPTSIDKASLSDEKPVGVSDIPDEAPKIIEQTPSPSSPEGHLNIFDTSECTSTTTLSSSTCSSSSMRRKDGITPSNLFISAFGSQDQSSSESAVSHVFCGRIYHTGQYILGNDDNLQVLDKLGSGTQATVYKVSDGRATFAVKISPSDDFSPELLSEFNILSSLNHKNVVAVYGKIPRGFLLDCLSNDLKTFIYNSGHVQPKVRDRLAIGILEGVDYIHTKGIAHLDIKPDNILLTVYGVPKLCDFGLAVRYSNADGSMFDIGRFYGTAHYASPEMYKKGWFASEDVIDLPKTDCWSVGVTLFSIMTGQPLFIGANEMEIFQNQRGNNYNYPPVFANISPVDIDYYSFMEMIKGLCKNDADARLSSREALSYECFK